MNTAYAATELGFAIDSTKENSTEDIVIDGFKLPKYIPPIVILNDKDMHFLSEQLESDPVKRSIIPTIDTPNHCFVVSSSQIRKPSAVFDNYRLNPQEARKKIAELKDKLGKLKNRSRKMSLETITEMTEDEDKILHDIIQYDLWIQTYENRREVSATSKMAYEKEVRMLLEELTEFQSSETEASHVEEIGNDINTLNRVLMDYSTTPTPENELELRTVYHRILSSYYQ